MDVTNSATYFIECGLNKILSDFEIACLIVSSLAHDVGHPGLNNSYITLNLNKHCYVFIQYETLLIDNDQSVLENYHASLLFYILSDASSDILKNL